MKKGTSTVHRDAVEQLDGWEPSPVVFPETEVFLLEEDERPIGVIGVSIGRSSYSVTPDSQVLILGARGAERPRQEVIDSCDYAVLQRTTLPEELEGWPVFETIDGPKHQALRCLELLTTVTSGRDKVIFARTGRIALYPNIG